MIKKVIVIVMGSIITVVGSVIGGFKVRNKYNQNFENEISLSKEESSIENETTENEVKEEIAEQTVPPNEEQIEEISKSKENIENNNDSNTKGREVNTSKTTQQTQQKSNASKTVEVPKKQETTSSQSKQVQNKQTNSNCQTTKDNLTEEITYNSVATQKLISDIDKAAKKNKSLFGASGNKLYKIEISKSLLGGNYMCPYRYEQVEGKVLNVFPVKFLVYAVDYKKSGFETQTRYYLSISNL